MLGTFKNISKEVEDKEVEDTFKRFEEESGLQAERLREFLNKYQS